MVLPNLNLGQCLPQDILRGQLRMNFQGHKVKGHPDIADQLWQNWKDQWNLIDRKDLMWNHLDRRDPVWKHLGKKDQVWNLTDPKQLEGPNSKGQNLSGANLRSPVSIDHQKLAI